MRITSKGQVTIPQEIRERAGLMPGTDVAFRIERGAVRIEKAPAKSGKPSRGAKSAARLRGSADVAMSTDEILALMRGPKE